MSSPLITKFILQVLGPRSKSQCASDLLCGVVNRNGISVVGERGISHVKYGISRVMYGTSHVKFGRSHVLCRLSILAYTYVCTYDIYFA